MKKVYVLGGAQTDFERNWKKEGKNFIALLKEVIDDGYRDIGGAIGFGDKESILNESDFCKLYRDKEGNILAVSFYADKRHPNRHQLWLKDDRKQNRGRKICCCAARKGYSEYLKKISVEDFKITDRNICYILNINY